jgi:16S rRNA (uracil1498-N3)-methyltransferase
MIRLYQKDTIQIGQTINLSEGAAHHIHVLRLEPGSRIILFCGNGFEFEGVIQSITKREVLVHILKEQAVSRESPQDIHLVQAISKGDRMELVVQKTVELGVTSITPIISNHCSVRQDFNRLEKKRAYWQAIAISACEQSGRNYVPQIREIIKLSEYMQDLPKGLHFVLTPTASKTWDPASYSVSSSKYITIGPEGGWSESELLYFNSANFFPISLGPRILRTETAAIAAVSILQSICGDM